MSHRRPSRPRHWIGVAGLSGLALLGATYWLTYEPAPRVRVLWAQHVTPERQAALEQRYLLVNPRDRMESGSIAYDLLDTGTANVRALVQDPAVADTGDIERNSFTIPFDAEYGTEWMSLAHRTAGFRRTSVRAAILAALAIMALWGLGPNARRAWQALRRAARSFAQG